jgi:hypothetical protein
MKRLSVSALVAGNWEVSAVVVGVPSLVLGPAGALLIAAIGAAVTAALLLVPFIGPLLALASAIIFGAFTLATCSTCSARLSRRSCRV